MRTLGYRAPLAGQLFSGGEAETAIHGGDGAAGALLEETGLGDRDVRPGGWAFEKEQSIGLNARLGTAPVGLPGDGGAAYVIVGRHWLGTATRLGFESAELSDVTPWSRAPHSRIGGIGIEVWERGEPPLGGGAERLAARAVDGPRRGGRLGARIPAGGSRLRSDRVGHRHRLARSF